MKFTKRHNNHEPGDPYLGNAQTGRFLYQRGVLEPDGGADDDAITRNPGRRAQQWGIPDEITAPPAAPGSSPVATLDDISLTTETE